MNIDNYAVLLLVGVALIAFDGFLIYRNGRHYLERVYPDSRSADAAGRLLISFFYLVMLGVFAIIATANVPSTWLLSDIVVRLGIMFLLLALGHALALWALTLLRNNQETEQLLIRQAKDRPEYVSRAEVKPVGQESYRPSSTPSTDRPYLAPGIDSLPPA